MIEKRLFHSQQLTVLVPISSIVSLFSSFFFFPSPYFILFLQPLVKHRRFFWARGRTALFWASIEMKSDSCAWGSGCVRAKRPSDSAYPNRRRPITGIKTNGAGSDRLRAFEAHFVPRSRADAQAPHTTGSVGAHKQAWPPLSPKSGGGDCV